jgi:hypothetical protein
MPHILFSHKLPCSPIRTTLQSFNPISLLEITSFLDPFTFDELISVKASNNYGLYKPPFDSCEHKSSLPVELSRISNPKMFENSSLTDEVLSNLCGINYDLMNPRQQIEEIQNTFISSEFYKRWRIKASLSILFDVLEFFGQNIKHSKLKTPSRLSECFQEGFICHCAHIIALTASFLDALGIPFRFCTGLGNNTSLFKDNEKHYFMDDILGFGDTTHGWLEILFDNQLLWLDPTIYISKYKLNNNGKNDAWIIKLRDFYRLLAFQKLPNYGSILFQFVVPNVSSSNRVYVKDKNHAIV